MQKEKWLSDFYTYIAEFRYYSYRFHNIPWIYRTLLYLPVGAAIEMYWLRKMRRCNREYGEKWLSDKP